MSSTSSSSNPAGESFEAVIGLTRTVVDTQFRLAEEYVKVARRVLSSDADTGAAGRAFLESVQRESGPYLTKVTELGVEFGKGVVGLGDHVSRTVLGQVSAAAGATSKAAPAPARSARARTSTRKSTRKSTRSPAKKTS